MEPERRLAWRAARQRGHVGASQALLDGLSRRRFSRLRSRGWIEVLPGILRAPGVPDTVEGRLTAAQLWMGEGGFFIGETAAFILKLDGITRPQCIHVALPRGSGCRWLVVKRLQPGDRPSLRKVNGWRVPEVERILLDCAATLPLEIVGRALDDALRRRMTTIDRLTAWLDKNGGRGRRGSSALRDLLRARDDLDERTRSRFESKMLRILRRIDGLYIQPNHPVFAGDDRYVIDFFLAQPSIGIECHSVKWHGGERSKAEVVRDRRIRSLGIELLYFSWDDVVLHTADTEREIRDAVGRRLARPNDSHG